MTVFVVDFHFSCSKDLNAPLSVAVTKNEDEEGPSQLDGVECQ